MDWSASGISNSYEFELLDRAMNRTGWLDGVTGGRVTESYRGDYRVSASLDIDGRVPPLSGYVRIWHVAELDGEVVRTVLATLCPERPSLEYSLGRWSGTLDLYSALKKCDETVRTAPGGLAKDKPLAAYWETMAGWGSAVPLVSAGISRTAKSTKAHVFEFGSPILSDMHVIASALGGYVEVDPEGRVCLVPYVAPSKRPDSWRLGSGERSIMLHGLVVEPAETVNRVAARYESNGKAWHAHADAPASDPRSAASLGRVVTEAIDVDTVVGGGSGWLTRYVEDELASRLSVSDSYEATILFDPSVRPGTAGTVDYRDSPDGDPVTFRAFCSQREIELDAAMTATLTLEAL